MAPAVKRVLPPASSSGARSSIVTRAPCSAAATAAAKAALPAPTTITAGMTVASGRRLRQSAGHAAGAAGRLRRGLASARSSTSIRVSHSVRVMISGGERTIVLEWRAPPAERPTNTPLLRQKSTTPCTRGPGSCVLLSRSVTKLDADQQTLAAHVAGDAVTSSAGPLRPSIR